MTRRIVRFCDRVAAVAMSLVGTVMLMLLSTTSAHAQPHDSVAAEALFRQAQALFDAGQPVQACPKFAASYRLAPGLGTLMNLARCYETIGKKASAWATWVDVEALAARERQADRQTIAVERLAALEPQLAKLTLDVPIAHRVSDLVVYRDGARIDPALFGVAVAVDAGEISVRAEAPGHEPWQRRVDIVDSPGITVVAVPRLTRKPAATMAPVPTPRAPAPGPDPRLPVGSASIEGDDGISPMAIAGGSRWP